jgi:hypothetical protein
MALIAAALNWLTVSVCDSSPHEGGRGEGA